MSGGGCHHLLLFLSLVNNVTHFATIFVCEPSFLFGLWLEAVSKRDFPLNSAHWTSTSPFSELTFFEIQFFLGRAKFKEKWHGVNIKVFFPGQALLFTKCYLVVFFTGDMVSKMRGNSIPVFCRSSFEKTQSTWCQLWWTHYSLNTHHQLGYTVAVRERCWLPLLTETGKIPEVLLADVMLISVPTTHGNRTIKGCNFYRLLRPKDIKNLKGRPWALYQFPESKEQVKPHKNKNCSHLHYKAKDDVVYSLDGKNSY